MRHSTQSQMCIYFSSSGVGNYALTLFWTRIKLNFKLMNITVHLLKTTIDEESNCVKIRWRITGLSNKSFVGVLKGWKKPRDVAGNIREYIDLANASRVNVALSTVNVWSTRLFS